MMALSCGGGFAGGSKVQPGSYVVTITGTSGLLHVSTNVTVVIKQSADAAGCASILPFHRDEGS